MRGFIVVIKNFVTEGSNIKSFETELSLPPNITHTQKLLEKKYTLAEIAATLKKSESLVSMQIETILEFNPLTEVKYLFSEEEYMLIISEVRKGYQNLKELKERLPSKISYPQIRIAAAKYKFNSRLLA